MWEWLNILLSFTESSIPGCVEKQSVVSQAGLAASVAQPGQPQPGIQPNQVSKDPRLFFAFQLHRSTSPQPDSCATENSKEPSSAGNMKPNAELVTGSGLTFSCPFYLLFLSVAVGACLLPAHLKTTHSDSGSEQSGYCRNHQNLLRTVGNGHSDPLPPKHDAIHSYKHNIFRTPGNQPDLSGFGS